MSIINNSHSIGVDSRNLVLKTRGTLHIKVGDRYYEIDFKNLNTSDDKDKEDDEDYIISVNSKDDVNELEYPGDNKLIVGLDGSFFITKNKTIVDVTPKQILINEETINSDDRISQNTVTHIDTSSVSGKLYNDNGYEFDFENGNLTIDSLTVQSEIKFPLNSIKNNCCKTYSEENEEGVMVPVKKYQEYDFIEIVDVPEAMSVKSGVMIKSTVTASIYVNIGSAYRSCAFDSGGLYIIYLFNDEVIQTKLN